MANYNSDNKRIAKNAMALYFRMFIIMLAGLYSSRVTLNALGVVDYGLNNVVGGFVSMFSLISGSLIAAISRFLTYEIGTGNIKKLREIFGTSIYVQSALAIIVIIVAETGGSWFLNHKLVIPPERMTACIWVFHLSLLSFILHLYSSPYNAVIIAHEKMGAFAYMSLFQATTKVAIALIISASTFDRLILLSALGAATGIVVQSIYMIYCRRNFEECTFRIAFSKKEFFSIFNFSGWSALGSVAYLSRNQVGNMMLNIFGGPAVNAAAGVASTITHIVGQFTSSFTQAFNPQITKSFASKEYSRLTSLINKGGRYSFYLMFILAFPLMFCGEYVLKIWLGQVPEHSVTFMRIVFIFMLNETISTSLTTAKAATGKIRNYQIFISIAIASAIPISLGALKCGLGVEWVYIGQVVSSLISFWLRMFLLKKDIPNWEPTIFIKDVFFNVLRVVFVSSIIPIILFFVVEHNMIMSFVISLVAFASAVLSILYVGCNANERLLLLSILKERCDKILRK